MGFLDRLFPSRSKPAPEPTEGARQFLGGFGRERARREHLLARRVHEQTGQTMHRVELRFPMNHVRAGEYVICDD